MPEHNTSHRVVVIGGGYAGTLAANRLRTRADVDITLVNPRPAFVERIRLHQFVAGTGEATIDYGRLLGDGIRLVVDNATRIDTAARTVRLASRSSLTYDYVVYAVGSTGTMPSSVPGVAEFAFSVAEFESAGRLRARLDEVPADAPVVVAGGGLTGVETAAELAERGRSVTLVCGGILAPTLSAPGRRAVARWLSRHGVTVLEASRVAEVRPDEVVLADGTARPSALTIWTAGFGVPDLAQVSGLRTDALGRLLTDETLTSVDDERVVAAGDAAAPCGQPLRMSGYAAGPLGAQAADTVLSRVAGTRRREDYIGPWLPEPLLLADHDASADVLLAESVSMAMLVLLETLTPDERAVFVLREVFGFDHHDIAAAVGKSVPAVRQAAHRAREHVRARRRRFEPTDAATTARITRQFMTSATTGDLEGLLALLAPDATWTADSGGKATAARRPVVGAEKIAALVLDLFRAERRPPDLRIELANCNNTPALISYRGTRPEGVFLIEIIDGRITEFYAVRNPDKLVAVAVPRQISR